MTTTVITPQAPHPAPMSLDMSKAQPLAPNAPTGQQASGQAPVTLDLSKAQPIGEPKEDKGTVSTVGSDILGGLKSVFSDPLNYIPLVGPEHQLQQFLAEQWDASMKSKKAMMESAKKGDTLGVVQHVAGLMPIANNVDAAMTKYQEEPSHENLGHIISAALPAFAPALLRGVGKLANVGIAEAVPASEVSESAEVTPKPGIVKQIVKGKDVAQPQAQEALKASGESVSQETGASTVAPKSLRETLTDPINANEEQAQELYKQIDQAAGTDFKGLGTKLKNTNRALSQSVDSTEEAKLGERRDSIEATIEQAKKTALEKGTDPALIDQADAHFRRMSALSDVETKVFKNPSIVSGNEAFGTEETVNIDAAIKALQKLQDSETYGAPRLDQAFGKEGAKQLLDHMYAAQRQGVHAMKVQKIAKWVGGAVATGTGATILHGLSAVSQ